jgi:hypothetical protein
MKKTIILCAIGTLVTGLLAFANLQPSVIENKAQQQYDHTIINILQPYAAGIFMTILCVIFTVATIISIHADGSELPQQSDYEIVDLWAEMHKDFDDNIIEGINISVPDMIKEARAA